ncbi:mannose-1-phosphate guanyltransferase, partial [Quaeritorhiza haematococci]
MSIEKEVFPGMARDGQLHVLDLEGFWADVGQPKDFLAGTALYLQSLNKHKSPELATTATAGAEITGNVLIHPDAKIGTGCKLGPNVVIGPEVKLGNGVRISKTVVMPHSVIKDNALVREAIVGWHSTVGRWARLDNVTVLGEDVHISDEVFVNGGSILPHK